MPLLVLAPAAAHADTVFVDANAGTDVAKCGTAPGAAACRTLRFAVLSPDTAAGDIVQTAPGIYDVGAGGLRIDERLHLVGAQAGVDARTRTPDGTGESVISGGPTYGLLDVHAASTTIDGFTISGNSGNANVSGAGVLTNGEAGYRIENNIFTDNAVGLYFAGTASTIARNLFFDNTRPGDSVAGTALYSQHARDVTITENRFQDDESPITVHATSGGSNVTVTSNTVVGEDGSIALAHIDGLTVADNTISGGSGSGIALGGDGLKDVSVLRNTITGKHGRLATGIRLTQFGYPPEPPPEQNDDVTIEQNTITDVTSPDDTMGNGIWIRPAGAQGSVRIARNRIVDNTGGLRNEDPDADVNASTNWWGCNDGPGFSGCDRVTGADGGSRPAYSPWLVLSLSAPDVFAARAGGSVLADVANRSSGGAAGGPFFASGRAAFASTPAGAFAPPSAPLDAALKARSVLTIAQPPDEVRTRVDNQTVRIVPSDPPAPDIVAGVAPDDPTVSAGQVVAVKVSLTNQGNRTARRLRACLRVSARLGLSGSECRRIAALRPGQTIVYHVLARAKLNACRGPLPYRLRVTGGSLGAQVRRALGRLLAGRCGNPPCPTAAAAGPSRAPAGAGAPADDRRPRARSAC
jgi:parallel beta-helix repeat protein